MIGVKEAVDTINPTSRPTAGFPPSARVKTIGWYSDFIAVAIVMPHFWPKGVIACLRPDFRAHLNYANPGISPHSVLLRTCVQHAFVLLKTPRGLERLNEASHHHRGVWCLTSYSLVGVRI